MAAKLEAQAASVMKLGPRRFRTLATRPETMFGSSPGIESSVIGGTVASIVACQSCKMAWRAAGGSWLKAGTPSRACRYSGKTMRCVVM